MKPSDGYILLVENDPDIGDRIARQALRPLGYRVSVVSDVSAAIQQAAKQPPDLVISNLNLPGLSGKDLLVALNSQGLNTPLIVIAERGQEQDVIQAFRLGAADYLLWPAREAEVVAAVERVLKQVEERRARRQLEQRLREANRELQRKVHELTTILGVGKAVVSITDQRVVYDRIVEGAVEVAAADMGWLSLREEKRGAFLMVAQRNLPPGWARKLHQAVDDGVSSLVALSGETLLIHGEALKRFKIAALGKSAAVVPIKAKDDVIGLLIVVRKQERAFGPEEQTLLEGMADYAAISLVNAHLFRALEQSAEAARSGEKRQNALLQSLRDALQNELRAALYPLNALRNGELGSLNKEQSDALQAIQQALHRLSEAANKTIPPLASDDRSNKKNEM